MTNKVRIAGAIASKTNITLYLEDGAEMNLPADSWRTKAILEEALPALARNEIVELDLETFSIERHIEKKSGGLIRFVREKIGGLFGKSKVVAQLPTGPVGVVPSAPKPVTNPVYNPVPTVAPVSAPKLTPVPEPEVLVAIVDGKRIPGVEALEKQMDYAAFTGNTIGLQRFLERIATVIDKRGHTVQELLNFMQRGDLPIADDGSIVAYKILEDNKGHFVDCHTRNVRQKLGSRVSMPIDRVDESKRTQCSTGLHIARRAYLGRFSGGVITLVKVAPEDVVAVPNNEPDKMRAAAYHIVAVLPEEVHATLRANKPMTGNTVAAQILADVVAGNHIGIVEEVSIGAAKGGGLTITPAQNAAEAPEPFKNGVVSALDGGDGTVNVRDIKKAIEKAVAEAPPVEPVTEKADASPVETLKPKGVVNFKKVKVDAETAPAPAPVSTEDPFSDETPAERRNRVKREKRAALKAAAPIVAVPAAPTKEPKLTKPANDNRDAKVLELLAAGRSQRSIEKELNISGKTIRKLIAANK